MRQAVAVPTIHQVDPSSIHATPANPSNRANPANCATPANCANPAKRPLAMVSQPLRLAEAQVAAGPPFRAMADVLEPAATNCGTPEGGSSASSLRQRRKIDTGDHLAAPHRHGPTSSQTSAVHRQRMPLPAEAWADK